MKKTFLMISALLTSACSVFGAESVETLNYTVVKQDEKFEVREYAPFIIASTTVNEADYEAMTNKGFSRLFDYISGENIADEKIEMTAPVLMEQKGEKIAMTAPVLMEEGKAGWTMSFALPSSYTLKSAPKPKNEDVSLKEVKNYKVAALRFTGFLNNKSIAQNEAKLLNWVESENLKTKGDVIAAGYNPPWTIPTLRRNEVMVEVK